MDSEARPSVAKERRTPSYMAKWAKDRRIEMGVTQTEVARQVGVNRASIALWESGRVGEIGARKFLAVCVALDASAADMRALACTAYLYGGGAS